MEFYDFMKKNFKHELGNNSLSHYHYDAVKKYVLSKFQFTEHHQSYKTQCYISATFIILYLILEKKNILSRFRTINHVSEK